MKNIMIVAWSAGKDTLIRYAETSHMARYWEQCLEGLGYTVRIAQGTA